MKKLQHVTQVFLTVLIFLAYSNLAQSSTYITDRGLIELRNTSNDLLAEIAKENGYTLDRSYTSLNVPVSNIFISASAKDAAIYGAVGGAGVGATGGLVLGGITTFATGNPLFWFYCTCRKHGIWSRAWYYNFCRLRSCSSRDS